MSGARKGGAGAGRRAASSSISPQSMSLATIGKQPPVELLDRSSPTGPWAERGVVASVLLDPPIVAGVAAVLPLDDLGDPICRTVYSATLRLHQRGELAGTIRADGELADAGYLDDSPTGIDGQCPVMLANLRAPRRYAQKRNVQLARGTHPLGDDLLHVRRAVRRATKHADEHRTRQRRRRGGGA